ncbi:DNA primase/helicase [Spirochaetia bacterium]|nr:DNA primase/helicase [Spirochaetia bacterium]
MTEKDQADAIVEQCGRFIKYCGTLGWLTYNYGNGCWTSEFDETVVVEIVKDFAEQRRAGAQNNEEEKFAKTLLTNHSVNAVLNLIKTNSDIKKNHDEFDTDPYTINCHGELWDLRTAAMRETAPEDFVTKTTRFKADSGKPVTYFSRFLTQITGKDGQPRIELGQWLLYFFGYCLSGVTSAQFFVNFHGKGNNGKSVLLILMLKIFGDYGALLSRDIVIENKYQSSFDNAALPGVRFAALIDAPDGVLNMNQLKSIVAGDEINAKRKFKPDFKFFPVCKIAIGSNPHLKLRETGFAVQRRIRLVPFDYTVPDGEEDPALLDKLLEEGEGITGLLVQMCKKYFDAGGGPSAFPPCDVVDKASADYLKSEDKVRLYVDARVEKKEGGEVKAQELYNDYVKWEQEQGNKPMSGRTFGRRVGELVKSRDRKNDGYIYKEIAIRQ